VVWGNDPAEVSVFVIWQKVKGGLKVSSTDNRFNIWKDWDII